MPKPGRFVVYSLCMTHKMTVLLVGSGGREHALAWKIAQSPMLEKLYTAPGNPGTAELGENVHIPATDIQELLAFAKEKSVDLVVVGPDDPLSLGIVDAFRAENIPIFGPTQAAAKLEWSKAYAKEFMFRHDIPTARYETFSDFEEAVAYADGESYPLVIKANGLAFGKGVVIAQNRHEALATLREMMVDKIFGEAGSEVVIEEFLTGTEISVHAFADGKTCRIFPSSQDHKRAYEEDEGPNTGGMGTISPVPSVTMDMLARIDREIVTPTLAGMNEDGVPFTGLLFPGIIITEDGPKVIEFNARFGDPETQVYMRLLESDILPILKACALGTLSDTDIRWKHMYACNIVLASGGYPGVYEKGKVVTGLLNAEQVPDAVVFHAGTRREGSDLVTSGGRVFGVSAVAPTLDGALSIAYEAADKVHYWGKQLRKDIGKKALIPPAL